MLGIAHLQLVPQHIFNELEEGGGRSHMGPSMCGFMSLEKVK